MVQRTNTFLNTFILYVPISYSTVSYCFTLTLVYQFPSLSMSSHIDYQKDTNICLNLFARNRFKMEPMYPRGPLTGRWYRADTVQYQVCQTRGVWGGGLNLKLQLKPDGSDGKKEKNEPNSLGPPAENT